MTRPRLIRSRFGRRLFVLAVAGQAAFVFPEVALSRLDAPAGCVTPTRSVTLYAEELPPAPDGSRRLGYGLSPGRATIPGPTIEMAEGDCIAITLVNDVPAATLGELRDQHGSMHGEHALPLAVSLHVHGVKYLESSDGTLHSGSYVPPSEARTFVWYAAPRVAVAGRVVSQGTAGYWWYHDHIVGTAHGTAGAAAGLIGGLIVRRAGDLRPDRSYTVAMGPEATINLRRFPATDCDGDPSLARASNRCFTAAPGERVEFHVIGFGSEFHTFHLHGHSWVDNRTGIATHQLDETRLIDAKAVGPSESFGFQIIAGEAVGPGAWMLHCHVQAHSDAGMTTFFHVLHS